MEKVLRSREETARVAEEFATDLTPREHATVVALSGELGAGKTTFTQEAAKALGVGELLQSPTFVIMKFYALERRHFKQLIHVDAYRLRTSQELLNLGFDTLLKDPGNLIFIEWAENVADILPKNRIKIFLEHFDEKGRTIKIE